MINANQTPHYQRHDFKNRRSSSEPANEQKLISHIQSNSIHNNILTSAINQNQTNQITSSNSTNNNSLVIDDASEIENPSDDFIDCLHQKTKVSKIKNKQKKIQNQKNEFEKYSKKSLFFLNLQVLYQHTRCLFFTSLLFLAMHML